MDLPAIDSRPSSSTGRRSRFLYLTAYFPPHRRVGALRPLKFVRHIRQLGWEPVVLCEDESRLQTCEPLLDMLPEGLRIERVGMPAAALPWLGGKSGDAPREEARKPARAARGGLRVPPEWLVLGEDMLPLPAMYRRAVELIEQEECRAIVVNADPYESILLGVILGRRFGLPVLADLGDPWSVCELRRHARPRLQRWLVDRLEGWLIDSCSSYILNTASAAADYRSHYPAVDPSRFATIRTQVEPALLGAREREDQASTSQPAFDRFTFLFMGSFRRFITGEPLLRAIQELSRRGITPADFQLAVSGDIPSETWSLAANLKVAEYVQRLDFVPVQETAQLMHACDALISLVQPNVRQRVAAKFSDYLASVRPILSIHDHAELDAIAARYAGTWSLRNADTRGIADAMEYIMNGGRRQVYERELGELDARAAAHQLANHLDRACGAVGRQKR